ncbi:damage-control phosphatase ARMT1 family protein [Hyperthermus butylicus]|uniref:Damage-control phosphatase ARMT1-like metal-binding domain-containing protein n=1 Tax=Hyperthermus butylicus (strain DSM 5456 / JCM 9403 / PLM1-5) TaxID=415426 RepID=A2BL56_HYPBU|nr:ARMT1-like domain-containing protein [Hyperthermus butylicus]ABM80717.1 hypothetical protein Hbut_0866 [Hyperthermus butylicus DSM 5456]
MRIVPYCVACNLMKRAIELEHAESDNVRRLAIFREIIESANLYIGPDIEAAVLATVLYRRLRTLLNGLDPYKAIIEAAIDKAVARARSVEETLAEKPVEEKLAKALLISALATGYRPLNIPDKVFEEPPSAVDLATASSAFRIGGNDTEAVLEKLKEISRVGGVVYYLFASVFELPYDAIVVKILREDYGLDVIGVARNKRFEDYAAVNDVEELGLGSLLTDLIDIGSDAATVIREEHEHIYEQISKSSLVIVKGCLQTLYFYNNPLEAPTLMLFTAVCPVLSMAFNVPRRSVNIVLV